MNSPSNDHDEQESIVFGIIGAPGIGKSVAMRIVEDEENRKAVGVDLGRGPIKVGVARKTTTRPNRGADDRMKESGVPAEEFANGEMIGVYTLSNNGAQYGYRASELNQTGYDLLIAEPSLHHLTEVEEYLGDRLSTMMLVASRQYRLDRLGGRGTEDMAEVRRRVLEGDAQIIMANILGAPMEKSVEELTDPKMVELFLNIRSAADMDEAAPHIAALRQYLMDYVGEADAEKAAKYADTTSKSFAEEVRHLHVKEGEEYISNVVTVDDSFLSEDPIRDGKFRAAILDIVGDVLREEAETANV